MITPFVYTSDYTIFDLETTGLELDDRIIEMAAIQVRERKMVNSFCTLVDPMQHIPIAASSVNHITDDMVHDALKLPEAIKLFAEFVGDDILVGHNIDAFDMKFIDRAKIEYIDGQPFANATIDSCVLARQKLANLSSRSLETLASFYSVSYQGAHRALQDCGITYQVYERLVHSPLPEEFQQGKMCPSCKSPMKLRIGKFGKFWGCTNYPNCKCTQPYLA